MTIAKTTAAKAAPKRAAAKPAARSTASAAAAKPATRAAARPAARTAAKPAARPATKVAVAVTSAPDFTKTYKLLTGIDNSEFCAKVRLHLENGYSLHGSPTMAFNGKEIIVGQAVTKPAAKKKAKAKGKKK
jgi:hypothetical protein